jgi:hypothetical protein
MTRIDAGMSRAVVVSSQHFAAQRTSKDSAGWRAPYYRTVILIKRQGEDMQVVMYSKEPIGFDHRALTTVEE